jgi:hypothetical protein
MRRLSLLALLCFSRSASAAHNYVPFTNILISGAPQGLWLADSDAPGVPPVQVTNQNLDGPLGVNAAIFHT